MIEESRNSLDILILHAGCHFWHFVSFKMLGTLLLSKQRLHLSQSNVVLLTQSKLHIY